MWLLQSCWGVGVCVVAFASVLWLLHFCCGFLIWVMTFKWVYFLWSCLCLLCLLSLWDMQIVVPNNLSAAKLHTAGINSQLNSSYQTKRAKRTRPTYLLPSDKQRDVIWLWFLCWPDCLLGWRSRSHWGWCISSPASHRSAWSPARPLYPS